jgi:hypothetical protein
MARGGGVGDIAVLITHSRARRCHVRVVVEDRQCRRWAVTVAWRFVARVSVLVHDSRA